MRNSLGYAIAVLKPQPTVVSEAVSWRATLRYYR